MTELKPCPFCAEIAVRDSMSLNMVMRHKDNCYFNKAIPHPTHPYIFTDQFDSWNTRTQSLTEKVKLSEPDKEEPIASEYWGQGIKWAKYHGYIKQSLNQASQEDMEGLARVIFEQQKPESELVYEKAPNLVKSWCGAMAEAILKEYVLVRREK